MGVSNDDEDGCRVDGDGSAGISPSWQAAEIEISIPQNLSLMAAMLQNFSWMEAFSLGFSHQGQYIGGRARLVYARGAHTMWWRSQR
jgi:hypothetical protein